jgi:hypothetical protein
MDYLCVMLQKSLRILLVLAYLLSVAGLSVRSHFCGDKLDSIHLFAEDVANDPCECVDLGATDCCTDVFVHVPVPPAQLHAKILSTPKPWFVEAKLFFAFQQHLQLPTDSYVLNLGIARQGLPDPAPQRSMIGVYRI